MGRKGLNTEVIAEAAIGLVEEKGYRNFSMRELAARLGVQPASLYNHVNGIEAVYTAVGLHGISILEKALEQAYGFQDFTEALLVMAKAYRGFAKDSPELYQAVIEMRTSENEELRQNIQRIIHPFLVLIGRVVEDQEKVVHFQRMMRSALHGFVSLEREGYLTYELTDSNASFHFMVESLAGLIMRAGEKENHDSSRNHSREADSRGAGTETV